MKQNSTAYRLIFGYLGVFLIFVGITCLIPLFVLIGYPNESNYWLCFFIPGICSIAGGIGLLFLLKGIKHIKLGKFQDSVLLVLIWLSAILICSVPFLCRGDMNFTKSIFETTSGFSTIGLTVFDDFGCHIFVFWRSLLTLIGGVGLVLVITTALSNKFHIDLYSAEGHNDKLLPNLRKSAISIFGIYLGIITVGTLAYFLVFKLSKANTGDEFFDALIHSISAVATGGFSSKANGLVELENTYGLAPLIEIISAILMLAGSINFLTHLFIITGKFDKVWKDCEFKFLTFLLLIFIPIFSLVTAISNKGGYNFGESIRHGAFTLISSITTTGFSTVVDVKTLGEVVLFMVVIMNIIGGGAGSTAGGVKQYRVVVAAKSFVWGTISRLAPSRMIFPHFVNRSGEEKEIKNKDSIEAFGYIMLYVAIMFFGGLLVTLFARDYILEIKNNSFEVIGEKSVGFGDGLFEFSNAISSTGLSNGITSIAKECASFNDFGILWTLTIGMFIGRLEILVIYFAFYRIVRDILGKETI